MPQDQIEANIEAHKVVRITHVLRAAGAAALITVVVFASSTGLARAGDGDDDDGNSVHSSTSFYDKFLQVIGVEGGSDIQYSERSPLVVPPTLNLPPPTANQPPAVADWPHDPDLARARKVKVKEKPQPHADYVLDSSRPLSPAELNVPGPLPTTTGGRPANADPDAQPVNPAVTQPNNKGLFSGFGFLNPNQTEYATFTGEPARGSLTDPPAGYLTPSPDEPYGVGPEHKKYKVPTVGDRAAGETR
jgi:hypothetical protein